MLSIMYSESLCSWRRVRRQTVGLDFTPESSGTGRVSEWYRLPVEYPTFPWVARQQSPYVAQIELCHVTVLHPDLDGFQILCAKRSRDDVFVRRGVDEVDQRRLTGWSLVHARGIKEGDEVVNRVARARMIDKDEPVKGDGEGWLQDRRDVGIDGFG